MKETHPLAVVDGVTYVNLLELEGLAKKLLTPNAYGYYSGGAETEHTLADNRAVYQRIRLLPRLMRDVSHIDMTCRLMGRTWSCPILVAPIAMQKMAHQDGERGTMGAAAANGMGMVVSTMGTTLLEDVAAAAPDPAQHMFQLYVIKDRDFTRQLVQRAEKAGYGALAVTVDAPRLGRREADIRNGAQLPPGMQLENLRDFAKRHPVPVNPDQELVGGHGSGIAQTFSAQIDPSVTWEFVAWLRTVTKLPIVVKGILAPADAQLAVEAGVDGLMLSNHGGRQLDYAPSPVEMLPHVVDAVGRGRVPIFVDGGIRRGTDVLKALALGADAVMVGRPVLWGLTIDGQEGARRVLELLKVELEHSMALSGCCNLGAITKDLLIGPGGYGCQSKL